MNRIQFHILLTCLLFLSNQLQAQKHEQLINPILEKMEWYGYKHTPSILFVHFDKNIYTSNENVWFSAYLLSSLTQIKSHHTLSVSLIRNDDSVVLANEKILMNDGLSFGDIKLPDSLLPGNYSLLAFTNIFEGEKPLAQFVQPITIKAFEDAGFVSSIKLAEKPTANTDSLQLIFKADSKDIFTLISNADVTYTLGSGPQTIKGKLTTNLFGEVIFKLPFKKIGASNNNLRIKASFKGRSNEIKFILPIYNDQAIVKFYPEGGNLINGNKTTIGWEVRDAYGEPMMISGILYKNGVSVDTIQTNGYGLGRFNLIPQITSTYSVKLVGGKQDQLEYLLPSIVPKGPTLRIEDAVCNDTLTINLADNSRGIYYGMVHNYTEHFFEFILDMSKVSNKKFRVPLNEVPKGITTISLLDSLGRPVAERLFFAHHNQRNEVEITTDNIEYTTRQKIKLNLQLKGSSKSLINGIVSISCIQDNRIDARKMTDIESYSYLYNQLASIPYKKEPMKNDAESINYWENILLVKGWRRYTWNNLLNAKAEDTVRKISSLKLDGTVIGSKKGGAKPFEINLVGGLGINILPLDSLGRFELPQKDMVSRARKKPMLFLNDKYKVDFGIKVNDSYLMHAKKLSSFINYETFEIATSVKNTKDMVLKQGEKATTLKEVVVTSSKKDSFLGRNECGDYVCEYNILNCQNHFVGKMPVIGKEYIAVSGSPNKVIYQGCGESRKENKFMVFIKGILMAKEFYNVDYTSINPSEQMFLSTLYWNYSLDISSKKMAEVYFYTSDITGKFRVIVQGITNSGVVFGEHVFTVKK